MSNTKVYTIHAERGYWYVDDSNKLCTSRSATAPATITDEYKFAVISNNDGYYFYSVKAKGFLTRHDSNGYFDNDMGNAFRLEENPSGNYKLIARMKYIQAYNNAGATLTINDNNAGSIGIDTWSNADGGNRLCIEEVEDFDPTNALALFSTDTKFNSHKVYTLAAVRGTWAASADGTTLSTTKVNTTATDEDQQFAVLKIDGFYYLYNVATRKFLMKDLSLSDVRGDAMQYFVRQSTGAYAFHFVETSGFLNMQNSGGYSLNGYNTPDDGNAVVPTEVDKDAYDAALAVFYGSQSITYTIKLGGNTIATEIREQKAGEAASLSADYTSKEFVTYTYSPSTIAAGTTNVEVTAAVGTLPFEVSSDYAHAHWYNIKIGANQRYVGKEDTEPYHTHAASDDSELDATEVVRAGDAYQWAFIGNPVNGFKVINKSAGATYSLTSEGTGENVNGASGVPNTVLRSGDHYWDIHQNGSGFSLNLIGKTNYYINTHGAANGYFQIWQSNGAKTDGGSRMTVEEVPDLETTITYNVYYKGNIVFTAEVPGIVGGTLGSIPASVVRDYVDYADFDGEATVTRGMVVNLTATWSSEAPFELSDTYNDAHWYDMAVRGNYYVTSDNAASDGTLAPIEANAIGLGEDAYQWAFVGDPYHIKLYNKAIGAAKVYAWTSTANGSIPAFVDASDGNYWWIRKSTASGDAYANAFMITIPDYGYQVNQFGGASGSLKIWEDTRLNDVGSAFKAFDVPADFHEYADAEIKPYAAPTGYFALTDDVKATIGWNDSYSTNCPFATYKAMKEALAAIDLTDLSNYNLPETGYYRIKSNMYGSYMRQTGSVVRGNDNGNADKDAASVVYLTRDANNNYSFRIQGSYIQAPTGASVEVTKGEDPVFFITEIAPNHIGLATFWGNPEVSHSALHAQAYGGYYNQPGSLVGWERNAEASWWSIEDAETLNITLNGPVDGKYYATLCVPFDVTVEGATAYTLTKGEGSELTMTEAAMVPAGTPVVLVGTSASATCIIGEGYSAAISTSTALTGSYLEIASFDGANNYVLGTDGTKAGFFHWNGPTLKANRAYIAGEAAGGADEVKGFYLNFGDTDGVKNVDLNVNLNDKVYDLSGRRVNQPTRGLYIVSGKKVAVK